MAKNDKKELTAKEKRYCAEFLIDHCQTKAAIRAGYPEKSAAVRGSELMKRPEIRAYVAELQKEQAERLCVNSDLVIVRAVELLDTCMAKHRPVMEWDYDMRQWKESGEYQIDSKGACRCLELLAKMTGEKQAAEGDGPVYYRGEEDIKE